MALSEEISLPVLAFVVIVFSFFFSLRYLIYSWA